MLNHPTVLVTEDAPMNAMLVAKVLKDIGIDYIVATTGLQTLRFYESFPHIDLILMDLHLPDMNGLDITSQIRSSVQYRQRPIPIIALTANALMKDKAKFLKETGLADYLTKPISKDKLLGAIQRHLKIVA